ncbi:energy-coupling factor transporter transmembrane component T family protein [Bartonella sp. B35(2025)]
MISLYFPRDTFIHKLKPEIKLLFFTLCTTITFIVSSIPILSTFLLFVALLYGVAKIPFSNILKQLKSISLFLALIFVFHVVFNSWFIGFEVVLRLVIFIFLSSLISLTTKVSDIVNLIEKGLRPLQYFGVNSSKFSMVLSMAIRFIPVISEKFHEVREAQQARGFDTNMFSLAIPLIIRTIKIASEVAEALDARSYDSDTNDKV